METSNIKKYNIPSINFLIKKFNNISTLNKRKLDINNKLFYSESRNNSNNIILKKKNIKILNLKNNLKNIFLQNKQNINSMNINIYKSKRIKSSFLNKRFNYMNFPLSSNKLFEIKSNNNNKIIPNNIYLPNIYKFDDSLHKSINNDKNIIALKKSKFITPNGYNNLPIKLPIIKSLKINNNRYIKNYMNKNSEIFPENIKKIRCNSSSNIRVKSIYLSFDLKPQEKNDSNFLFKNDKYKYYNIIINNKINNLNDKHNSKMNDYVNNSLNNIYTKNNEQNNNNKVFNKMKIIINNKIIDDEEMLNDKGTLISYYK